MTPDRDERRVCELCRDRAEDAGWVWDQLLGDEQAAPARRRPRSLGASLRERAGRLRERARRPSGEPDARPSGEPEAGSAPAAQASQAQPQPSAAPPRPPADPAAPGAHVGRAPAVESPQSRRRRALERFNASPHARTVAGLTRTLGKPWVSVGAAAGSPRELRVTVAWELTWYQWGVDLRDDAAPVHELARGDDPSELDGSARQWNARVDEDGRLVPEGS